MAYGEQSMSGNRVTALIIVALIHVVVGYALVTGLAYEAAKKVIQRVTTVDIKEEVKKEEPPPPAPVILAPPPVVAPPPPPSQAKGATPRGQSGWAARIQDNYPARALREEKEGRVGVRVTIGPDGRVSSCNVTSSSGTPDLDQAACEGMQRYARYNPALDDAGRPTTGTANTAIVYRIN